jgi:hypothetical protein
MEGEDKVPAILYGKGINPFISKEILAKTVPVVFRLPNGSKAYGYRAELLPRWPWAYRSLLPGQTGLLRLEVLATY